MSALMLGPHEVPLGIRVHLIDTDTSAPVPYEEGGTEPAVFRALVNTFNFERYFHSVDPKTGETRALGYGVPEDERVRFSPIEVYTPDDAPVNGKFAVFSGGRGVWYLDRTIRGYAGFYVLHLPHSVYGDDVLGRRARRYELLSDEELVKAIQRKTKEIQEVKRLGVGESSLEFFREERTAMVHALALNHEGSRPADLISVLYEAGMGRYVERVDLPADAQLVRVR